MKEFLKSYPVIVELPVLWGEMDAFGHVNNVVFFRYLESARVAYFEKINFIGRLDSDNIGPILASTQCKFKIPLIYPDKISVGARVSEIQEDRFVMEYLVVSHTHQAIAAEGDAVVVSFNYRESKKVLVPRDVKKRIEKLEKPGAKGQTQY